jgi:hypothetical protein
MGAHADANRLLRDTLVMNHTFGPSNLVDELVLADGRPPLPLAEPYVNPAADVGPLPGHVS